MKIAIGSDHTGYESPEPYKPALQAHIEELGHQAIDCGTDGQAPVDYPDFANKVSEAILSGKAERGILICGTGIGISIAANRHPGIRAATCATEDMVRLARQHNDANIICVGRRILSLSDCIKLVDIWLDTPFSEGERHERRISKMD